jgi:hypothetical protein
MRRWAIAFALGAALVHPAAGHAAEEAEPAEESEAEEPGEESSAEGDEPADEEGAKRTSWHVPRRPDLPAGRSEEPSEYEQSIRARFLTGLNGVLTAPADPVMAAVDPPKALEKASYVRHPLGFASGCLLMIYRSFLGLVDLGLAPLPELPVVSPVPRYKLIPGFEHEDE